MAVQAQKRILIVGAGIAGPALALFLSRLEHKCTIVERAPGIRKSGQQVDVSGEGIKVVQYMGIEEQLMARTVRDDGIKVVEEDNKAIAEFPVAQINSERSIVKEIEVMRFDVASMLYERTKDDVEYIFDDQVDALQQDSDTVTVKFAKSRERQFDFVVAADGIRSATRERAFDASNTDIVSLGQFVTFFDVPWQEADDTWSRAYGTTNGRTVLLRPNKKEGFTGAYLSQLTDESGRIARLPFEEQRQEVLKIFGDLGWETPRILEELKGSRGERCYIQENAQVKAKSLSSGRVVLLGDAGYCPSPLTGQGTTLAFIGAYILAGCIATYGDDEALTRYDSEMRPFIQNSQHLPPGVPWIVHPQSSTGITLLKNAIWIAGWVANSGLATAVGKAVQWLPSWGSNDLRLPEYPALKVNE